jgi:DNA-directed RNA polymerase subunit RPC12/RpoP
VNAWRKAFARHRCPECGAPVLRVGPPLSARLRFELVLLAAFALLFWLAATLLQWSGLERGVAWAVAFVAAAVALYPAAHITRRYRCLRCERESGFGEVVSAGWALLR